MSYPTLYTPGNMHRLFDTFSQPTVKRTRKQITRAAVNVAENEDGFRLELAAPGWNKNEFNIELDNDTLTISAEREKTEAKEGETFLRREFATREFKRTFTLPDTIDTAKLAAEYNNGILTLTLPKKEEAKPQPARKMEIA